jgi:hypothetical protein
LSHDATTRAFHLKPVAFSQDMETISRQKPG